MEVVVLVFRTIRDLKGSLKVGSNHSQWQRVVVFGVLVDTMLLSFGFHSSDFKVTLIDGERVVLCRCVECRFNKSI
ncbi:hypothetical protein VIGAN_03076500 [Vigna angularis var. angularis]|uniref:Uncharacterized protein n=1 Tax=Vigna angularis var. angularis TaxID=157739 RepID=A0A0S3RKJ3_PHAAN|nr:hypothetical protein VIGAN_03076500 [Vigna angularis var. angularis]